MTNEFENMDWDDLVSSSDQGMRGIGGVTAEAQRRLVFSLDALKKAATNILSGCFA